MTRNLRIAAAMLVIAFVAAAAASTVVMYTADDVKDGDRRMASR